MMQVPLVKQISQAEFRDVFVAAFGRDSKIN